MGKSIQEALDAYDKAEAENTGFNAQGFYNSETENKTFTNEDIDNTDQAVYGHSTSQDVQDGEAADQGAVPAVMSGFLQFMTGAVGEVVAAPQYFATNANELATIEEGIGGLFIEAGDWIKEKGEEIAPIHQSAASRKAVFDPTNSEWWASSVAQLGSTLGMMAAVGVVEGITSPWLLIPAGRALSAGKLFAKGSRSLKLLRGINAGVTSRLMENTMEARETFDQVKDLALQSGVDVVEANRVAGESAASTYNWNWGAMVTDIGQYAALFGAFGKATSKVGKTLMAGVEAGTESVEEGYQYVVGQESIRQGKQQLGIDDTKSNFGDRFSEYLQSTEMQQSMVQGAMGGALFQAMGPAVEKLQTMSKNRFDKSTKAYNKVTNTIKESQKAYAEGDMKKSDELMGKAYLNGAISAASGEGVTASTVASLEGDLKKTDEELAVQYGGPTARTPEGIEISIREHLNNKLSTYKETKTLLDNIISNHGQETDEFRYALLEKEATKLYYDDLAEQYDHLGTYAESVDKSKASLSATGKLRLETTRKINKAKTTLKKITGREYTDEKLKEKSIKAKEKSIAKFENELSALKEEHKAEPTFMQDNTIIDVYDDKASVYQVGAEMFRATSTELAIDIKNLTSTSGKKGFQESLDEKIRQTEEQRVATIEDSVKGATTKSEFDQARNNKAPADVDIITRMEEVETSRQHDSVDKMTDTKLDKNTQKALEDRYAGNDLLKEQELKELGVSTIEEASKLKDVLKAYFAEKDKSKVGKVKPDGTLDEFSPGDSDATHTATSDKEIASDELVLMHQFVGYTQIGEDSITLFGHNKALQGVKGVKGVYSIKALKEAGYELSERGETKEGFLKKDGNFLTASKDDINIKWLEVNDPRNYQVGAEVSFEIGGPAADGYLSTDPKKATILIKVGDKVIGQLKSATKAGTLLDVRERVMKGDKVTTTISDKFMGNPWNTSARQSPVAILQEGKPLVFGYGKNGRLVVPGELAPDNYIIEGQATDGATYQILEAADGSKVHYRLFTAKLSDHPKQKLKVLSLLASIKLPSDITPKLAELVNLVYFDDGNIGVNEDGSFFVRNRPDGLVDNHNIKDADALYTFLDLDNRPVQIDANKLNTGNYNTEVSEDGLLTTDIHPKVHYHSTKFQLNLTTAANGTVIPATEVDSIPTEGVADGTSPQTIQDVETVPVNTDVQGKEEVTEQTSEVKKGDIVTPDMIVKDALSVIDDEFVGDIIQEGNNQGKKTKVVKIHGNNEKGTSVDIRIVTNDGVTIQTVFIKQPTQQTTEVEEVANTDSQAIEQRIDSTISEVFGSESLFDFSENQEGSRTKNGEFIPDNLGEQLFNAINKTIKGEVVSTNKEEASALFRKYAKEVHPDKHQDELIKIISEKFFKAMTIAKEEGRVDTLKKLKVKYDAELDALENKQTKQSTSKGKAAINFGDIPKKGGANKATLYRAGTKTTNLWDKEKETAWFKQRFPNVEISVLEDLSEVMASGKDAWGMFHNAAVYIQNNAAQGTTYHEAFHVVFNLFLNDKQKASMLTEAYRRFGKDLGISKEEFKKALSTESVNSTKFKLAGNEVEYSLKAVNTLQTPRASQMFAKGKKNGWDLNKILTELAIPKEQKQLVLDKNINDREDIITSLLAENSFVVEVNTAKTKQANSVDNYDDAYEQQYGQGDEIGSNTSHYSNLTVPGGTNYTENEVATPAITPNIKGHAQFSTDNGIGWFRSDDQVKETYSNGWIENINQVPDKFNNGNEVITKVRNNWENDLGQEIEEETVIWRYNMSLGNERKQEEIDVKTRRILEVQSDLFQKGRGKKDLITVKEQSDYNITYAESYEEIKELEESGWKQIGTTEDGMPEFSKPKTESEKAINKADNQFLQLLNKKGNWVNFFIQSVVQDSAKKGYEKVLFPSGDTAAKIEGHQTLEGFKKDKEARIEKLDYILNNLEERLEEINEGLPFKTTRKELIGNTEREKKQLKKELADVESGQTQLSSIAGFYENTVANILKKNYNVTEITDEHGNKWNEVDLSQPKVSEKVLLKTPNQEFYEQQGVLVQLEEALADAYMDMVSSNKAAFTPDSVQFKYIRKTLGEKIAKFFERMWQLMKHTLSNKISLDEMFYRTENGFYSKKNIKPSAKTHFAKFKKETGFTVTEEKEARGVIFNNLVIMLNEKMSVWDKSYGDLIKAVFNTKDISRADFIGYELINRFENLRDDLDPSTDIYKFVDQIIKNFGTKNESGTLTAMGPLWELLVKDLGKLGFTVKMHSAKAVVIGQNEEEDHKESWMIQSIQIDPKMSLSAKLKTEFATVPKVKFGKGGKVEQLKSPNGLTQFEESSIIYNKVQQISANSVDSKHMMDKLREAQKSIPWMKHVIDKVEADPGLITDLWVGPGQKVTYNPFMVITKENQLRLTPQNKENVLNSIVNNWADSFSRGNMLTSEGTVDVDKAAEVKQKLDTLTTSLLELNTRKYIVIPGTPSAEDTTNTALRIKRTTDAIGLLHDIMNNDLGFTIGEDVIAAIATDYTPVGSVTTTYGHIQLLRLLEGKAKDKYNVATKGLNFIFKYALLKGNNPFAISAEAASSVKDVAKMVRNASPEFYQSSYRNIDGKKVFGHIFANYATTLINKIRGTEASRKEQLDFFLEDEFYKSSPWLNEWKEGSYSDIEFGLADGLKRDGDTDGISYAALSSYDFNRLITGLYFNNNHKTMAHYSMPILETTPILATIKHKKYKSHEDRVKVLVNIFKQEHALIQLTKARHAKLKSGELTEADLIENREIVKGKTLNERLGNARGLELHYFNTPAFDALKDVTVFNQEAATNAMEEWVVTYVEEQLTGLASTGTFQYSEGQLSETAANAEESNSTFFDNRILAADRVNFMNEFLINDFIAQTQIGSIFSGTLADYKGVEDFFKRSKQVWSPGTFMDMYAEFKVLTESPFSKANDVVKVRENYLTTYLKDEQKPSLQVVVNKNKTIDYEASPMYKALIKANLREDIAKKIVEPYKSVEVTDAQAYIDIFRYREQEIGLQRWTSKHEKALPNIIAGIASPAQLRIILQPRKPFYFGRTKGVDGAVVNVQNKNSELLLIPQMANGNPIMEKMLENMGYKDGKFDMKKRMTDSYQFDSAVKVGSHQVTTVETMTIKNSIKLNNSDWRLQMETPQHFLDTENLLGTQLRKLILGDIDLEGVYTIDGKDMTGQKVKELYKKILTTDIDASFATLLESFKDKESLIDKLREGVISQELGEDYLEALEWLDKDKGTTKLPLWHPVHAYKVSAMLNSLFKNEITRRKINGASLINASTYGMEVEPEVKFNETDGSIDYVEAYLPAWHKDLLEGYVNSEGIVDVEKLTLEAPELLDLVVYRIPTEDKYSMFTVRVKGFLPIEMGGAIIMPREVTTIAGLDFDIDKVFAIIYNHTKIYNNQTKLDTHLERQNDLNETIHSDWGKQMADLKEALVDGRVPEDHPQYEAIKEEVRKYNGTLDIRKANKAAIKRERAAFTITKTVSSMETKETRDNYKLDIIHGILKNKATVESALTPGGFDEYKKIVYIVRILQQTSNTKSFAELNKLKQAQLTELIEDAGMNVASSTTKVAMFKRMMTGAALIGVFANHNAMHAVFQDSNLAFSQSIALDKKELKQLNGKWDSDTVNFITRNVAELLAASVDNGKDPLASFANVTLETADVLATLLQVGFSLTTAVGFIAQPSLQNVSLLSEKITSFDSEREALKVITAKYKKALDTKVKSMKAKKANLKAFDGVENITLTNDLLFRSIEVAGYENLDATPVSYLATQLEVLKKYMFIKDNMATPLAALIRYMKIADNGAAPTFSENTYNLKGRDKIGSDKISNLTSFLNDMSNPMNLMRQKGVESIEQLVTDNTDIPLQSALFSSIYYKFEEYFPKQLSKKEYEKIYNNVYSFLATRNSMYNHTESKKILNSLPKRISTAKKNTKPPFHLLLSQFTVAATPNQLGARLVFDGKTGKDDAQQQDIKDMFKEMLAAGNKTHRQLAIDLIKYDFYVSGFSFTPTSYTHVLPVNFFAETVEGRELIEEVNKSFNDSDSIGVLSERFIEQYTRNYWNKGSFVPAYTKSNLESIVAGHLTLNPNKGTVNPNYLVRIDQDSSYYSEKGTVRVGETYYEPAQFVKSKAKSADISTNRPATLAVLYKFNSINGNNIVYEKISGLGIEDFVVEMDASKANLQSEWNVKVINGKSIVVKASKVEESMIREFNGVEAPKGTEVVKRSTPAQERTGEELNEKCKTL